jgi:hypothetical protein
VRVKKDANVQALRARKKRRAGVLALRASIHGATRSAKELKLFIPLYYISMQRVLTCTLSSIKTKKASRCLEKSVFDLQDRSSTLRNPVVQHAHRHRHGGCGISMFDYRRFAPLAAVKHLSCCLTRALHTGSNKMRAIKIYAKKIHAKRWKIGN